MGKNIVICADGTGNTFDDSVSNITRMIRQLDCSNAGEQVTVYDQGIGTNAIRQKAVLTFMETECKEESLHTLPGPKAKWFDPAGIFARLLGLGFGYGLKANVGEMWQALGKLYKPGDSVYLFGYSRGAFAVRALAGLIYRCGIPGGSREGIEGLFDESYRFYQQWERKPEEVKAFRDGHPQLRDCRIHFLGIYDTVKSYGGIIPIILPHLRHNPIVDKVRHAVALDECRAWFNTTTWGRLDSDKCGAALRLTELERFEIAKQDIEEVWFAGCHSHVGGGDKEEVAARITLRWMMGEAADAGLRVRPDRSGILDKDPTAILKYRSSFTLFWKLLEIVPRKEIDNSGVESKKRLKWLWTGKRKPCGLARDGKVLVHSSAQARVIGRDLVEIRFTKPLYSEAT